MTYCVYVESTNFSSQQTKQKITNILSNCVCLKKSLLLLLVFKKEMKQIKKNNQRSQNYCYYDLELVLFKNPKKIPTTKTLRNMFLVLLFYFYVCNNDLS